MTNYYIDKEQNSTVNITLAGDNWIFDKTGSINAVNSTAIFIGEAAAETNLEIRSAVTSTGSSPAVYATATDLTLKLTESGSIHSESAIGLRMAETSQIVETAGRISGAWGLWNDALGSRVTNSGTIFGTTEAVHASAGDFSIYNQGTIKSQGTAIVTEIAVDHDFTLQNKGKVIAMGDGPAIRGSNGIEVINNDSGTIRGDVLLGGNNDALWFKGGHIDGVVRGGKGDDSYYLDGFTKIAEAHNSGTDRVESSISWHLGKNFENLTLSLDTQAKLAATGNGLGNILTGNDGANAIKGLGGDDRIDGRHGADILTGGHGTDTFVFMLNSGRDHVTDFTATGSNHDFIEFNGASVPYEDLLLNMEQKRDDVVISLFGYDMITLEDVKLQDLTSDNFHFITT